MPDQPPSPRQLNYLKALAAAHRPDLRLAADQPPGERGDRPPERRRARQPQPSGRSSGSTTGQRVKRPRTPSPIHGFEVVGYGSTATWSQRS